MANSLLTGNIELEEEYGEELQQSLSQDETDQSIRESQSNDSCGVPAQKSATGILSRPEQRERPKLKKRVSFDQESIERKRGKVSRRPRRRRNVPVASPLRDFFAIMATFLFTALFSSLLRDRQRQAQQDYLNRKAQSSQKGDLSSRRKRWQQERKKIQIQPEEPETIYESVVSSEHSSQVESQIYEKRTIKMFSNSCKQTTIMSKTL
mmetsp:Transcript_17678/g.43585  ORF Transcript_17678/g.43585 Transcript_17678/m.43585 type:complete len:208 (+) Transcript_17678:52-675(+)